MNGNPSPDYVSTPQARRLPQAPTSSGHYSPRRVFGRQTGWHSIFKTQRPCIPNLSIAGYTQRRATCKGELQAASSPCRLLPLTILRDKPRASPIIHTISPTTVPFFLTLLKTLGQYKLNNAQLLCYHGMHSLFPSFPVPFTWSLALSEHTAANALQESHGILALHNQESAVAPLKAQRDCASMLWNRIGTSLAHP